VDLDGWYSAGRWVALIELIEMLPSACRLNEAIVNDPEQAELMARQPKAEGGEEWAPRVADFKLEHHMLRDIISELKRIGQVSTAQLTGKPQPMEKPFPMPRTAIDAAIAAHEREWAEDFVAQFGFDASDI